MKLKTTHWINPNIVEFDWKQHPVINGIIHLNEKSFKLKDKQERDDKLSRRKF